MKIAQVSPLYESVPPSLYGGTERVVSYLCEELVAMGHDVALYASGDSETSANLIPMTDIGLRLDGGTIDNLAPHYLMIEQVIKQSANFDIIHFHIDYLHFALSRRSHYKHLTTLHGRLDIPEIVQLHEEYSELPLVSISDSQRRPLPNSNWVATVYHGIPSSLYRLYKKPQPYLAFLGRISPEKRLDRAIRIADLSGIPLKVSAKIDNADINYYESVIKPVLKKSSTVEFIGEIGDSEKQEFLGNAMALLFPIDWPEPFGLVMIEAMACGTPVIAFDNGSVSEVIDPGLTGYLAKNVDEAADLVRSIESIDRAECRKEFERRFSARRMAMDYLSVYKSLGSCSNQKSEKLETEVVALR